MVVYSTAQFRVILDIYMEVHSTAQLSVILDKYMEVYISLLSLAWS